MTMIGYILLNIVHMLHDLIKRGQTLFSYVETF